MLDAPTSKIDVQFAPDFLINLGRDTDAPRLRDRFKAGRNVNTVPEDDAKAVSWFRKATEQGDAWAQYNLGWMYDQGEGVPQDDAEAVKWYRLAAEQGYSYAQYSLGRMYRQGEGVPEDNVYAYMWWNIAASQGDADASTRKREVAGRMSQSAIEEAQRLSRECVAKDYKDC